VEVEAHHVGRPVRSADLQIGGGSGRGYPPQVGGSEPLPTGVTRFGGSGGDSEQ